MAAAGIFWKVIERFGPVRPFVNIVAAEERHIRALLALLAHFRVEPPQDPWPERVGIPRTLQAA